MSNEEKILGAIVRKLQTKPPFSFGIGYHNDQYTVAAEFGKEADDSPMYGGASYGVHLLLEDALLQVAREIGAELPF